MRGPLVALLACIAAATSAAAEPSFPYKACVTADDVYVRSGPGDNYYPTDKLKAGTEVEIYRHDPGGWYAIRPPKGSFSWVSSRHLQFEANNLATVTDERIAARVGSRISDTRDVIQVRLHKGETVEVLESRRDRKRAARRTATTRRPGARLHRRRASSAGSPAALSTRNTTATACGEPPSVKPSI